MKSSVSKKFLNEHIAGSIFLEGLNQTDFYMNFITEYDKMH